MDVSIPAMGIEFWEQAKALLERVSRSEDDTEDLVKELMPTGNIPYIELAGQISAVIGEREAEATHVEERARSIMEAHRSRARNIRSIASLLRAVLLRLASEHGPIRKRDATWGYTLRVDDDIHLDEVDIADVPAEFVKKIETWKLDKMLVKKHFKETGEVPTGVAIRPFRRLVLSMTKGKNHDRATDG